METVIPAAEISTWVALAWAWVNLKNPERGQKQRKQRKSNARHVFSLTSGCTANQFSGP